MGRRYSQITPEQRAFIEAQHMFFVELARRLNCDEKEVRRLLDPRHGSKLSRMENAMRALGRKLVVHVADLTLHHAG